MVTGIRPGEKIHEILLSEEEATRTVNGGEGYFALRPMLPELAGPVSEPALVGDYSSANTLMSADGLARFLEAKVPEVVGERYLEAWWTPSSRCSARAPRSSVLEGSSRSSTARAEHVLVHTGQNFDDRLSGMFFRELGVREPDVSPGRARRRLRRPDRADPQGQRGGLRAEQPDTVLILGDTNTGLAAFVARRMGLRVRHMEAGNRCYDDRVPEEVNRRVIDHSQQRADAVHAPQRGEPRARGHRAAPQSTSPATRSRKCSTTTRRGSTLADPFTAFGVEPGRYFLVTAHRAETVDVPERLAALVEALDQVADEHGLPILASLHPRTADRMRSYGVSAEKVTSSRRSGCPTSCDSRRRRSACSPTAAPCRRSAASSGCPR